MVITKLYLFTRNIVSNWGLCLKVVHEWYVLQGSWNYFFVLSIFHHLNSNVMYSEVSTFLMYNLNSVYQSLSIGYVSPIPLVTIFVKMILVSGKKSLIVLYKTSTTFVYMCSCNSFIDIKLQYVLMPLFFLQVNLPKC